MTMELYGDLPAVQAMLDRPEELPEEQKDEEDDV
jgi:hypothetical protein